MASNVERKAGPRRIRLPARRLSVRASTSTRARPHVARARSVQRAGNGGQTSWPRGRR
ncbi:hypothetical protein A7982_12873 [Minicystis rosea]|nr:hypothetical protein A7982_12873 [Minicystis rosea]